VNFETVPKEAALAALDADADGRITIEELLEREKRPSTDNPAATLRWEERTMRIEEAVQLADSDHDGALSQEEFGKHHTAVVAAILGKAPTRRAPAGTRATVAGGAGPASVEESDGGWGFIGLVAGNLLLLLVGVAWLMRRRA
jgi:hypothetical protein